MRTRQKRVATEAISRVWFRRRRVFKVFTIYGHDGNLGHVTRTIWTNFCFPILMKAPYEILLQSAQWFQRKICLKILTTHIHTDIHTYGRQKPTYTISSPMSLKAQVSYKTVIQEKRVWWVGRRWFWSQVTNKQNRGSQITDFDFWQSLADRWK